MLEDNDVMLPEGWQEGEVLFDEPSVELQENAAQKDADACEAVKDGGVPTSTARTGVTPSPDRPDQIPPQPAAERAPSVRQGNSGWMPGTTAPSPGAAPTGNAPRDYRKEVSALLEARPELKGAALPDSVHQACVRGKSLLAAYTDYEVGRERSVTERLRRENAILRQNASAAARAPVSGTQGGGAAGVKEDDFMRGFNSED